LGFKVTEDTLEIGGYALPILSHYLAQINFGRKQRKGEMIFQTWKKSIILSSEAVW